MRPAPALDAMAADIAYTVEAVAACLATNAHEYIAAMEVNRKVIWWIKAL